MHPFQSRMICQVCPDKKRVSMATDDAKRIKINLNRLMDRSLTKKVTATPVAFYDAMKCQYTAGACGRFRTLLLELRRVEQELKECYDALCANVQHFLDAGEEDKAASIAYKASQNLRGHYPQAVRFLARLKSH